MGPRRRRPHHLLQPTHIHPTDMDRSTSAFVIDGFRTPLVDVTDLAYQADPNFMPDKTDLWKHPESNDGWVLAHNAVRFEIGEMKRVVEALSTKILEEWEVMAVKAWWSGH